MFVSCGETEAMTQLQNIAIKNLDQNMTFAVWDFAKKVVATFYPHRIY